MADHALRLLLVEDNPKDARLLDLALGETDGIAYRLEVAPNLAEGVRRLIDGGIHLVLLDLGLPDSQGLDTLVRLVQAVADVPIVVLTGLDDEEMEQAAKRRGAMGYLVKGRVTPQNLVHVMQDAVARRDRARKQAKVVFGNKPGAQAS
ncbi:MAG: phosphoserine phosphatase RsbU/P [Thermoplasmata archaeon]|jgi:DNA-binding response OmpR family regulator|nr:phosphoserine phosphatase RsbU/P [Thermoplasmata archaeon]